MTQTKKTSPKLKTVAKLMSPSTIKSKTSAIAKRAMNTSKDIHKIAMEALKHIAMHGDSTPARDMCLILKGNGVNTRALVQWFEKWGLVEAKALKTTVTFKSTNKNKREYNLSDANANPFYQDEDALGRTNEDKAFDFRKFVENTLKRLRKEADKDDVVNAQTTRLINAFVAEQRAFESADAQSEADEAEVS